MSSELISPESYDGPANNSRYDYSFPRSFLLYSKINTEFSGTFQLTTSECKHFILGRAITVKNKTLNYPILNICFHWVCSFFIKRAMLAMFCSIFWSIFCNYVQIILKNFSPVFRNSPVVFVLILITEIFFIY